MSAAGSSGIPAGGTGPGDPPRIGAWPPVAREGVGREGWIGRETAAGLGKAAGGQRVAPGTEELASGMVSPGMALGRVEGLWQARQQGG
jgi:hypothetical protein